MVCFRGRRHQAYSTVSRYSESEPVKWRHLCLLRLDRHCSPSLSVLFLFLSFSFSPEVDTIRFPHTATMPPQHDFIIFIIIIIIFFLLYLIMACSQKYSCKCEIIIILCKWNAIIYGSDDEWRNSREKSGLSGPTRLGKGREPAYVFIPLSFFLSFFLSLSSLSLGNIQWNNSVGVLAVENLHKQKHYSGLSSLPSTWQTRPDGAGERCTWYQKRKSGKGKRTEANERAKVGPKPGLNALAGGVHY